jgi:hypothetical protein
MLLDAAGGSLLTTSLMKALFYFDLACLRDTGEQPTGVTYLALKAGPVVARYERRVITALEVAGLAQQDEEEDGSKPVCLICAPGPEQSIPEHRSTAVRIGRWAKRLTPTQLSELSHHNVGWQIAWDAGLGSDKPARPINLRIAMQQVLDEDPWLDVPPGGEVASAFFGADTAPAIDW